MVAPGRWQLPGGSVEPPQDGEALDEAARAALAGGAEAVKEGADVLGVCS